MSEGTPMLNEILKKFDEEFRYTLVQKPEGGYLYVSPNAVKAFLCQAMLDYARSVVPEEMNDVEDSEFPNIVIKISFNGCRDEILSRIQQDEDLTK